MASLDNRKIGFIGLGAMGYGMAQNLARKLPPSTSLTIFDINQDAVESLATEPHGWIAKGTSSRDVFATCDIVITMLPEGKHVKTVYTSEESGLSSMNLKDKIFIDCSTIDVETCLAVKDFITDIDASASFYDSPVSGGVAGANEGKLAFFIGGSDRDPEFGTVEQVLRLMGTPEKIVPCGKTSAGLVAKLCHNYLAGILNVAAAETMNLGIRSGMDPNVLYRVLVAGAARNRLVEQDNPVPGLAPTSPSSNGYRPGFRASLMHKDVTLAVALAKAADARLVLGQQALDTYTQALPEYGDMDFTVIYRLFAE
ncbi:hypothetical protein IL306_001393 [Fusarium sp. DS 682]|nr:hypothetical protein IL306_001393 [Fusarium sp. DS 682]